MFPLISKVVEVCNKTELSVHDLLKHLNAGRAKKEHINELLDKWL